MLDKNNYITVYTVVTVSQENGLAITQQYAHEEDDEMESVLLQDVEPEVGGLAKDEERHVLREAWRPSGFTLDGLTDTALYKLNRVLLEK